MFPVLVLAGDLDTLTPPSEGEAAAALFPNSTFVSVANTGHVTALDDCLGMRVGDRHRLRVGSGGGRHVVRGHDPRDPHGRSLLA